MPQITAHWDFKLYKLEECLKEYLKFFHRREIFPEPHEPGWDDIYGGTFREKPPIDLQEMRDA